MNDTAAERPENRTDVPGSRVMDTEAKSQEKTPDPIDEQAAHIDARSEDAPEQIAELVEHAEQLGRDVSESPIALGSADLGDEIGDRIDHA